MGNCPELDRLAEDNERKKNWKRWGPYLAERQWGTVREDYSANGDCWNYLSHDHARSRAYRWGEDGILGWTDRECRLCFAPALWNGADPILKERAFGLTNSEGNHGEDVKEAWFHLDGLPTHSYQRGLYKYPQRAFPYEELLRVNGQRSKEEPEYEITDTAAFAENRYFDVEVEYAKAAPEDILIRITAVNRGPEAAVLHLLPTLWFRNTWSWGPQAEETPVRPELRALTSGEIEARHATLGDFRFQCGMPAGVTFHGLLFTENETNLQRLFGAPNAQPYVKDAFHEAVVHGDRAAANPARTGTKACAHYEAQVAAGASVVLQLRLTEEKSAGSDAHSFGEKFNTFFAEKRAEADTYYRQAIDFDPASEEARVMRQAHAGLTWSKQFYCYEVPRWLKGDPTQPAPPPEREKGRNHDWPNIYNRDVLSMPDTWEYPWYASWDLAFHCVELARLDPQAAKVQLTLFLREWYMAPNGQVPAYEFNFSDVNPPVHAWAAWRVYKITGPRGARDLKFLESSFQKLLMNFTWWVNRKDSAGRNLFAGGFLGLDNIGVFDRSKALGEGNSLEQADGTAWMASYCLIMLNMALELALVNNVYEDIASKFFEHFVSITRAINTFCGTGLWDATDGFYYDRISVNQGEDVPLKVRSIVGLMPLLAVTVIPEETLAKLPNFDKRAKWFLENQPELGAHVSSINMDGPHTGGLKMLSVASKDQITRMLRYMLDETEFLSPHGLRSVSQFHRDHPFIIDWSNENLRVDYTPGDSVTGLFGGNSNWRGPVWFPVNYLLVEALERYHHFYDGNFKVECPTGSGQMKTLREVAQEIRRRLASLFLPGPDGVRPYAQSLGRYANDPLWRDHLLFNEYFHGDNGRGLGATHQTGWTALVADCLRSLGKG
jgi:hypothetical protein